jgi:hypothetical protein
MKHGDLVVMAHWIPARQTRERSGKLVYVGMNIESTKAALMPVVHQAPTIQTERPKAPATALSHTPEPINHNAQVALENRKRVAVVERLMGMNKSLIVEKDAQRVGFVYKTIDKNTGEITRVWPQKEVASTLMALADKDAQAIMQGMMIDTSV